MRIAISPCMAGGYVDMHNIELNGAEQNICRDCVDKICMKKTEKLNKVEHRNV